MQSGQGRARPFLVADVAQRIQPSPLPALASQRYLRDLDEVRRLGGASSADAPPSRQRSHSSGNRHPKYPSGHGRYAGAAEVVLRALAGPKPAHPITVTSTTAPGASRTYTDWARLTRENVNGRVREGSTCAQVTTPASRSGRMSLATRCAPRRGTDD